MKTTEEIATKCDLLDEIIEQFIAARDTVDGSHEQYEAPLEALNLCNLTIRNVEGVIALARTDLVLLPPAQLAARAAFESSVRAAWLVYPKDPFEREARWAAHLTTEEKYLRGLIREHSALKLDVTATQKQLHSLTDFRERITSLLQAHGYSNVEVPHFRECLRSIGEERVYFLYMKLSQVAHATHSATWLYRSGGLGTAKVIGEVVTADVGSKPLKHRRVVQRHINRGALRLCDHKYQFGCRQFLAD
jgi:hypothetical protein